MKNKLVVIAIIILAGTAIVLGYAILRPNAFKEAKDTLFENRFGATTKQEEPLQTKAPAKQALLPSAKELGISEEEHAAIDVPSNDASVEEKQKHFELVQKVAKEAAFLDITKCEVADPVVLKVKLGEPIAVKNQDDVEHALVLNEKNAFPIPANSTKEIEPDFAFGPGTYGYGCDGTPHAVGIFVVI